MRFECYRNKAVVIEVPIEQQELIESTIDTEPIVSESEPEIETTSDTTEEVSTLSLSESMKTWQYFQRRKSLQPLLATSLLRCLINHQNMRFPEQMLWLRKNEHHKKKLDKVIAYTKQTLVLYLDEAALNRLCGYVTEYYLSDTLPKSRTYKG